MKDVPASVSADAMPELPEYIKVVIELPADAWHGYGSEALWARRSEGDPTLLFLDNIPFFAMGVSCGDLVEVAAVASEVVVQRIIKKHGHSTYRICPTDETAPGYLDFLASLDGLGCSFEGGKFNEACLIAIDASSPESAAALYPHLEAGEAAGLFDFEEGDYCPPEGARAAPPEVPPVIQAFLRLEFPWEYDEGADMADIDFEPYDKFLFPDEATEWFHTWTGNCAAKADQFLIFGQDGSGGLAAVWLARSAGAITEQPIVFFGSEGEFGVVAGNFAEFICLVAQGIGPAEAVKNLPTARLNPEFRVFAETHASGITKSVEAILRDAKSEFSSFDGDIKAICR